MPRNPYLAAWRRRRRNENRSEGARGRIARLLLPALAALVLVPLVRPVFLSYLDLGPQLLGVGTEGVLQRAGLALIAILAIDVYSAMIRGPDRAVLDLLPVDAGQVAWFEILRVGWERLWLIPLLALLLGPIGWEASWAVWGLCVVSVTGAWVLGIAASAMVHLLAVDVAESERWAPLMELLRGHNPRAQAAFLYAPGVVLAGAGALVLIAASGVRSAIEGQPASAILLALPFVAAAACAYPVADLARRSWFRASAVLADIDARYASLMQPEEGRRVYLDWAVRWLPSRVALYALKDLRHGWRSRRAWITGAWLAGVGAALVGWSGQPGADARAAAVVAGAAWLLATVGVVLVRDDPPFLERWLPQDTAQRAIARLAVLFAWLQGCIWPPVIAVAIRHGAGSAAFVLAAGLLAALVASVLATAAGALRDRGLYVYGPLAAVAAAGGAAWILGAA